MVSSFKMNFPEFCIQIHNGILEVEIDQEVENFPGFIQIYIETKCKKFTQLCMKRKCLPNLVDKREEHFGWNHRLLNVS